MLCRGLGEYLPWDGDASYTIGGIICTDQTIFYSVDAQIVWLRRLRYHLDSYLKVDQSNGYSLDATFSVGTPRITTTRTYSVYKVKVPVYDD